MNVDQNIELVKSTRYDGKSHVIFQDSILNFTKYPPVQSFCHLKFTFNYRWKFSKMSTYFEFLPFKMSLFNFSVHVLLFSKWSCGILLSASSFTGQWNIKVYTEIQKWNFKWQIPLWHNKSRVTLLPWLNPKNFIGRTRSSHWIPC